jgi:hypothetical protein
MSESELDALISRALSMEWELAEFIAYLIYRACAHEECEDCRYALDRSNWPNHPVMALVIDMIDNA